MGSLYSEGGGKEAGHSKLVDGSFNKQRELTYKTFLEWQQRMWIPTSIQQTSKVCLEKEALARFSQGDHADVLNSKTSSQGCVLGAVSGSENGKWNPHSKDRGGAEEPSECPSPVHGPTSSYIFSTTFPNPSSQGFLHVMLWLLHFGLHYKMAPPFCKRLFLVVNCLLFGSTWPPSILNNQ